VQYTVKQQEQYHIKLEQLYECMCVLCVRRRLALLLCEQLCTYSVPTYAAPVRTAAVLHNDSYFHVLYDVIHDEVCVCMHAHLALRPWPGLPAYGVTKLSPGTSFIREGDTPTSTSPPSYTTVAVVLVLVVPVALPVAAAVVIAGVTLSMQAI
jgi:hypothetical protein